MKTLKFKSSLKCNGCVNAIKPGMEAINDVKSWRVFLDVSDKIIEVETEGSEEEVAKEVKDAVTKAGYRIEQVND